MPKAEKPPRFVDQTTKKPYAKSMPMPEPRDTNQYTELEENLTWLIKYDQNSKAENELLALYSMMLMFEDGVFSMNDLAALYAERYNPSKSFDTRREEICKKYAITGDPLKHVVKFIDQYARELTKEPVYKKPERKGDIWGLIYDLAPEEASLLERVYFTIQVYRAGFSTKRQFVQAFKVYAIKNIDVGVSALLNQCNISPANENNEVIAKRIIRSKAV